MKNLVASRFFPLLQIVSFALLTISARAKDPYEKITFNSTDGLTITADLYSPHKKLSTPFIILCHQARSSRGEYREIAPRLNELGFNCMAIDQRSGDSLKGIENETAANAKKAQKTKNHVDAEQDIIAAIRYAKNHLSQGKLILWGSSYSASLVLRIAGENSKADEETKRVDGVLAFSPGEYFKKQGQDWITSSARKITCPVFITSAKHEVENWAAIFRAIQSSPNKVKFIPTTGGNHGSKALWKEFNDSVQYWKATESFLKQFL